MVKSKPTIASAVLASLSLLGVASAALYPSVGEKFKFTEPLTGRDPCALLSVVVDESGSMRNEHKFLQLQAIPELVKEIKAKNYFHVFICSHGFGSVRSTQAGTGFQFHGCIDTRTWSDPIDTNTDLNIMSTWMTLGGTEDAYLGAIMGVRNTPATISGTQLNTTCGTMAKNMLLVTDEDRDTFLGNAFTKADVEKEIKDAGFVFNAIVNLDITGPGNSWRALGFETDNAGDTKFYIPDGSGLGTYTPLVKQSNYGSFLDVGGGGGTSKEDYPPVALNSGGAIWDLGMLRTQNANYTKAFVTSFVDKNFAELVSATPGATVPPGTVPPTSATVPPTTATVPPTSATVPPTTATVPPTSATVPPTSATVPPTSATVPPTSATVPPTSATVPPTNSQIQNEAVIVEGDTSTNNNIQNEAFVAGSVKGDPHFKTWKNEHFEYHGQCDMVLVNDPDFANGLGLDIHVRSKLVRFWSYIQSAVIRIGNDILELQGSADPEDYNIHYWINYEFQGDVDTIGGFPVNKHSKKTHSHKNKFEIDLSSVYDNAPKIIISTFKEFLKVEFENASGQVFGNSVGMLGNFNSGKTLARDGSTVIDDFTEFGQEWQVLPSDGRLFRQSSSPQFPELCIEPEDPRGERRRRLAEGISGEEAEAACASLKDPLDRKDCVYDILATQDVEIVGAY